MSRTVHCRKYGKPLPGLDSPPLPGPVGQEIFENVSAKAWSEWTSLQTMLINEYHLSLRDSEARSYLLNQMNKFFRNEETDQPEGYVPTDTKV